MITNTLNIHSSNGAYPVYLGDQIVSNINEILQGLHLSTNAHLFIVSDSHLQALGHVKLLEQKLQDGGYSTHVAIIPAGDESKSISTLCTLYDAMLTAGIRRNGVVIALGGGVVGDLSGFAAATFLRGIVFLQMPTTLLAHDSSIGGKTGINLPQGKNLVGAFYPPHAVLYDVSFLSTLPVREWRNGMAEVIKHGVLGDADLFLQLETSPVDVFPGPSRAVSLLAQAMSVKIHIVEQDEHETGARMLLNLGHTVGHAVEQCSHYSLGHGEAISIGMIVENQLAVNRGLLLPTESDRIRNVLLAHGLPAQLPDYEFAEVATLMDVDKKNMGQQWTLAVPTSIGTATVIRDVTAREVENAWHEVAERFT